MTYTYTWANAEQTHLRREDSEGQIASVPLDPDNRDYQAYLRWLDEGNTPAPAPAPPEPPAPLTPAEKLAASGLTVEELKGLLGL